MAIAHADNFNIYGNSSALMLNGLYASVGGDITNDPDGVSTPKVFQVIGGARLALPESAPRVGVAQRVWLASLPTSLENGAELFAFLNLAGGVPVCSVVVESTGALTVTIRSGDAYVPVATTPGPVITANAWWHVECAVEPVTGSIEIRVEGVPVIDATGLVFTSGYTGSIYSVSFNRKQGNGLIPPVWYIKDYVIWNSLGTQNTDFLGAVIVYELDPISDVSIGGWVPSTGVVAWDILDGTPGETPYLSADNTPPAAMTVNMSNLPDDVTSVKALVSLVRAKKVDGGDGNMQVTILSNGDSSNGADRPITAAMTYWRDVHEIDPDTGSPWTPAAVDLATLKINRTV